MTYKNRVKQFKAQQMMINFNFNSEIDIISAI